MIEWCLYWLVLVENMEGETTPKKKKTKTHPHTQKNQHKSHLHLRFFYETNPDITIPPNSLSDLFFRCFCFSSFITVLVKDLESGMTAIFPLALHHFISSIYHLTVCSLVTHYGISKLKMKGVVDDWLLSNYPECLSKAVGRRHKPHLAVILTVKFIAHFC